MLGSHACAQCGLERLAACMAAKLVGVQPASLLWLCRCQPSPACLPGGAGAELFVRPSGSDPLLLGLGWADEGQQGGGEQQQGLLEPGQQQQWLSQLEAPGVGGAAAQHASGQQVALAAGAGGSRSGSGGWCDGDAASLAVQRVVQQRELLVSPLADPAHITHCPAYVRLLANTLACLVPGASAEWSLHTCAESASHPDCRARGKPPAGSK